MAAGRGNQASIFIVDTQEILLDANIRSETITMTDLNFPSTLDCIIWLAKRRLITNWYLCPLPCDTPMSLVKKTVHIDGYQWRCKNCMKRKMIRCDSFFKNSHLSLEQISKIIYGWANEFSQKQVAREVRISKGSTHTIIDWYNLCRNICAADLMDREDHISEKDMEHVRKRTKLKLLRQCGTSDALFPSYLQEDIWRNKHDGKDIFSEFIITLNRKYSFCEFQNDYLP